MTDTMHMREFLAVVRKRWPFVAVLTVLCMAVAGVASYTATPIYKATASVYFSLPYGNSANDISQGSTFAQNQVLTYAEMAKMPIVVDPASKDLGISSRALGGKITAQATPDTVIVTITASDPSARQAARAANAIARNLGRAARELSPKNSAGDPSVDARTIGSAKVPSSPATPQKKRNLLIALLAGLVVGIALAFGYELVDTRIRSRADVEDLVELPVLGEIQTDRTLAREHVVMIDHPTGVQAEAFRRVVTNLTFLGIERPLRLAVTSTLPQEGKSSIAANIAIASAEAGARTLLIDADLRSPSVANYTGLEGAVGLANVLIGQVTFDDVVQSFGGDLPLDVLTGGPQPPNPGRLLASDAMTQLLDEVGGKYDVVILDCAPLLAVTDAAVLAREVSGAIVVTRVAGKGLRFARRGGPRPPSRAQLKEALASLDQLDAEVLGVVVNGLPRKSEAYYGYGGLTRNLEEPAAVPSSIEDKIAVVVETPEPEPVVVDETPEPEPVVVDETPEPEPVVVETPEPEPVVVETPEPEPVVVETPEPEPVVVETPEPEPVVVETPEPEPVVVETPEPEPVVVETPEPEPVVVETPEPEPVVVETPEPEPVVVETPEPEPVVVDETPEPEHKRKTGAASGAGRSANASRKPTTAGGRNVGSSSRRKRSRNGQQIKGPESSSVGGATSDPGQVAGSAGRKR